MGNDPLSIFGAQERPQRLPPDPNIAVALAILYSRLGGYFSISSNGVRGMGQPVGPDEIPQLPHVDGCDRFHSEVEWEGAIKLVRVLLSRLDDDDTDLVFGLFASVACDPRKLAPSIEEPKREAFQ